MIVNTTFTNPVYQHHSGLTFLDMLEQRFTYRSRESWRELINAEVVLLNDCPCTPETLVSKNDTITYLVKDYDEPDVPTNYSVIYENADVIVVNKPPQVPVQQTGRIIFNTMTNMLRRAYDNSSIVPFHRIDRETSGMMVFATNNPFCKAHQKHSGEILNRKFYLAIVAGEVHYQAQRVSVCLGEKANSPIRNKMYVDEGKQQLAESTFHTIATHKTHSLLLVEIHTGRKHQIRAQCENLGHSIVGDKIYSHHGNYYLEYLKGDLSPSQIAEIGSSRMLLHSFALDLHLPNQNPRLLFAEKTCAEFKAYAQLFENWIERSKIKVQELLASQ